MCLMDFIWEVDQHNSTSFFNYIEKDFTFILKKGNRITFNGEKCDKISTIFEGTFDDLDYFVDDEEYRDFDISFISVDCTNKKVELIIDSSGCYKGGYPTMKVKRS